MIAWLRRLFRRPTSAPARCEPCRTCHEPVALDVAHRVVATFDDATEADLGGGGGTAMVAEYHPRCCPGGCTLAHAGRGA